MLHSGMVLAAPQSGSGKTTITCALLAAMKNRKFAVRAFKSGPHYIDPMFHRQVIGCTVAQSGYVFFRGRSDPGTVWI